MESLVVLFPRLLDVIFLFNYGGLMVDEKTALEILPTKLHRPPFHRDHIPRLLQAFDNSNSLAFNSPPPRGYDECFLGKRTDTAPITSPVGPVKDQCELMVILKSLYERHLPLLPVDFLSNYYLNV